MAETGHQPESDIIKPSGENQEFFNNLLRYRSMVKKQTLSKGSNAKMMVEELEQKVKEVSQKELTYEEFSAIMKDVKALDKKLRSLGI